MKGICLSAVHDWDCILGFSPRLSDKLQGFHEERSMPFIASPEMDWA